MLSCSGRRGAYALPISIQLSLCFFYDSYLVPVSSAFRFVDQRSFKFATFTIVLVSKLNVLRFSPLIIVSRCNAGILAKRAFANIRNIGSERGRGSSKICCRTCWKSATTIDFVHARFCSSLRTKLIQWQGSSLNSFYGFTLSQISIKRRIKYLKLERFSSVFFGRDKIIEPWKRLKE